LKPRLAFLTHVDWGHIRQRPHQLAVALARHYDVSVIAPVARHRARLVVNPAPGVVLSRLWRLPGSYRSELIASLNARLASVQCAATVRSAAIVVVTSPELHPWVGHSLAARTLVYDCPDDALAFRQDPGVRDAKARWERELIARADVIACASDELAARMRERGGPPDRICVIRNGWDPVAFPVQESSALPAGPLRLAYFGTLAPWLDIDALGAAIRDAGPLSIRLIGPQDQVDCSGLPGITVEPPWPHDALAAAVADAHCMLLPFRVDALIRAVDPVKLYEYIALGKPILSSYWPALEPFAPFVTFYRDAADLVARLRERRVTTPPPRAERAAFLEPQSWMARASRLHQAIAAARGSATTGASASRANR